LESTDASLDMPYKEVRMIVPRLNPSIFSHGQTLHIYRKLLLRIDIGERQVIVSAETSKRASRANMTPVKSDLFKFSAWA
jgi:hypothetical protein